ncbi:hypothetical protein PLICRDRAFT_603161 [Plicaturopsis crispa FD-325 SS-3]|nr:hypothetical protein PLICRDRAFT_603161 [Plicaturopsis crispa FD-325 SS-3]
MGRVPAPGHSWTLTQWQLFDALLEATAPHDPNVLPCVAAPWPHPGPPQGLPKKLQDAVDVMCTWQAIVPAYREGRKKKPRHELAPTSNLIQDKYLQEVLILKRVARNFRNRATSQRMDNIASNIDLVALMVRWMLLGNVAIPDSASDLLHILRQSVLLDCIPVHLLTHRSAQARRRNRYLPRFGSMDRVRAGS